MYNNEIQAIISQLKTNIPQYGENGYYIQTGVEGFKFTDNIPFWFYIDWPEGENFEIDHENVAGCTSFHSVASLRLITHLRGVNLCDAVDVLVGNLLSVGINITVQSVSIDETTILEETWQKKPKQPIKIMRILFQISKYGKVRCTGLVCDDGTC